jgi:hypothetical protein
MNKTDNTKQVRHVLDFTTEMFTLTLIQTGTATIKLSKTTSKQLLYKLCFTVEQPLIHKTAGLFKSGIKTLLYFCKLFIEI